MRVILIGITVLCFGLISVLLFSGCKGIVGSGKTVSQNFSFKDFTTISAGWAFEVEISKGPQFALTVASDDNLQGYLDVSQNGETLRLQMRDGYTYINSHLKAAVTMPRLTGVTLSGASRCSASGFNSAEDFVLNVSGVSQATFTALLVNKLTLDISGASRVNGDVDSKGDATLQASGASNIEITGKTVKLIVEESGASTVNLLNFAARDVQVNISGASNATINATGIVSGDISGASRLYYTGTPALGDIHTSGASSISKK